MTKHMDYRLISWSPFATNILDAGEFDLCTPDGKPVDLHRDGMDFVLIIGEKRIVTPVNVEMSMFMNRYEVGGVRKAQS